MPNEQYVCLTCGYNMVGYHPDKCPFCGAPRDKFISAQECTARYRVQGEPVNENVTRLNSHPALGIEHAAYRIETGGPVLWIDCPSSFNPDVAPMDMILFTHHHFLGACNLYREHFDAPVHIHTRDSAHDLCRGFTFDQTFEGDFQIEGLQGFHIAGHTPGFTFYLFEKLLLVCDYFHLKKGQLVLTPYGPRAEIQRGARRLAEIIASREIQQVCGHNYVLDYETWREGFDQLDLSYH